MAMGTPKRPIVKWQWTNTDKPSGLIIAWRQPVYSANTIANNNLVIAGPQPITGHHQRLPGRLAATDTAQEVSNGLSTVQYKYLIALEINDLNIQREVLFLVLTLMSHSSFRGGPDKKGRLRDAWSS